MRSFKPTTEIRKGFTHIIGLAAIAGAGLAGGSALAQGNAILEEITVTAQRRVERLQDVPISVTAVSGERLESMFEGGEDIRALATRVPSLYAESSNGRLAPRFYIRGLGNTDFDLAASQPVSIVVDEVVLENVILKSFPLFDIDRVEVLRGPQGTLFGRNTPAGIVKFETRRPTEEFEGYASATVGEAGTLNFEGAVGGALTKSGTVMGRLSVLSQNRDDWIDNGFTGEKDAMGGYEELAWRGQLLIEPSDNFSALLNVHGRDLEGTASIFQANIVSTGSNKLNRNFTRDVVYYDSGENNPQEAQAYGGSLRLDFDFANDITMTSITAFETVENFSRGDIDGGVVDFTGSATPPPGIDYSPETPIFFDPDFLLPTFPGMIFIPSESQDGLDNLDQFTQEFRLASEASDRLFWQAGVFFFDSEFDVTTFPFFVDPTTLRHTNSAWAVFGQVSYDVTTNLNITGGVRYTDDEKDLEAIAANGTVDPVSVGDENVSGDLSANYSLSDNASVYARFATGFRAPTIQGRDVAFGASPSTAESETITSFEVGFKSTMANDRVRMSGSLFSYTVEDQQLTAVGGTGNFITLVNADETAGYGFDLDSEFLFTERLLVALGLSWNHTEIDDQTLEVASCGSGLCTPLDPDRDNDGFVEVNGNPLPQAPEWIATLYLNYTVPLRNGELFFSTDWAWQTDTHFFLYQSQEYRSGDTFEGGLRAGYTSEDGRWQLAVFGRNITDEENLKGGIDFSNNTGFVNDRRIFGATFRLNFGGI